MKFLSLAPFVPSGSKYEELKQLFQELGFKVSWDEGGYAGFGADGCNFILQKFDRKEFAENFGQVTQQPYGKEVNIIDIAGVCWHFIE